MCVDETAILNATAVNLKVNFKLTRMASRLLSASEALAPPPRSPASAGTSARARDGAQASRYARGRGREALEDGGELRAPLA